MPRRLWFLPCLLLALSSCAIPPPAVINVRILAINDFHGNLLPPNGGMPDPADPSRRINAGGAEYLATLVAQERAGHPNTIFVGAGDLIGASPLLSGLFHDEPTVEALSTMGLAVSAVGNHEFDKGLGELRRMQNGGCAADGCKGPHPFTGASFHYLAASTVETVTAKTIFPPYEIRRFDGIPVAFIGLTLKGTPDIVTPSGVAGLEFRDEAQSVNALIPQLRAQGVEAIIVLIHQGGALSNPADYNGCTGINGAIAQIVPMLDKAVDVVVSGHTHQAYNCVIDGRLVTSAYQYGMMLTEIDLTLDGKSHDVVASHATNLIVRDDALAKDPEQSRMLASWQALAGPIAGRIAGKITAPLPRDTNAAGESAMGDVIADAQLAAAKDADIALMNAGGVRAALNPRPDGTVTYSDLFAVQPFGNFLVTISLTGAQLKTLLEQQWLDQPVPRILQISSGFAYSWDASAPPGARVSAITLNGAPLVPEKSYRVVLSDFLADGGDGMSVLRQGADRRPVMPDMDALAAYFAAHTPLSPPPLDRIRRRN